MTSNAQRMQAALAAPPCQPPCRRRTEGKQLMVGSMRASPEIWTEDTGI